MFHMKYSSSPPSLKLPLMDNIAKAVQNQETVVKPEPSSSTSPDIGQFVPNPQNRDNWYPMAVEKFPQDPKLYHKHSQILQDLGTKAYLQPLSNNENWSSWNLWSENA